jgi:hypothetical protein
MSGTTGRRFRLALARRSWRHALVALAAAITALAGLAGPAQGDIQPLVLSSLPVSATVGTPFTGAVGTLTVSDPLIDVSQYSASISWGDKDGSVATISMQPSGSFLVSGTHTYARSGTFNTTILVDNERGPNAVAFGTAIVSPAPPAPAVSGISPNSGPEAGGTSVTITGTNFLGATDVDFGTTAATDVKVDSPTQITATAPAGTGIRDVTVTTPSGTSAASRADLYTYIPAPTVTGVSPASGPEAGGTSVTITGTDLSGATAVDFGTTAATDVKVDSPTQITATAPAGTGSVDVTVATPSGTSATSDADQYSYVPDPTPAPTVTGISPTSGPESGGTRVTITGTDLSGATGVQFGKASATNVGVDSPTQITATAPAGSGAVDVTVTTPRGSSATTSADRYTYVPAPVGPQTGSPSVSTASPTMHSSTGLSLAGSVNPEGLVTTAYFEYGLDSRYTTPGTSGPNYDQTTTPVQIGSDFQSHPVFTPVSGLVPNALYHARLVATNTAGTTFGPDVTFTTPADPAPGAPKLASSFNVAPISGVVLILVHGKFVPLTEERSIPAGTIINTLKGTLKLITATGNKDKNQNGTFGGAVFKVTQFGSGKNKGLTTLALVEGVKGGPSYASCKAKNSSLASVAGLSNKTLQLLHGSDNHAKFRTKGRYSAATIRGTVWTIADRCDGTFVHVIRGLVDVTDFVRHITVAVHAGHSYLALAKPKTHR